MERSHRIILVLTMATVITLCTLPCPSQRRGEERKEEKKEDIWTEGEPRGPRRGPGRGPGRLELTDEEIDRIMKSLKQSNPEKAKELKKLRKEDPNQFKFELMKQGGEEFGKIMRERMDRWREQIQAEFLEWLEKNYEKEAKELAKLKERDPDLYWKKFDLLRREYWRIFEEERRNPELAKVLKEDLELKKRSDELVRRIKATNNENEKQQLMRGLEIVVSRRFDLIIKQKEMEYERLLKRLEELKKRIMESREEITEWRDAKFKADSVKKRIKDLIAGGPFKWD